MVAIYFKNKTPIEIENLHKELAKSKRAKNTRNLGPQYSTILLRITNKKEALQKEYHDDDTFCWFSNTRGKVFELYLGCFSMQCFLLWSLSKVLLHKAQVTL